MTLRILPRTQLSHKPVHLTWGSPISHGLQRFLCNRNCQTRQAPRLPIRRNYYRKNLSEAFPESPTSLSDGELAMIRAASGSLVKDFSRKVGETYSHSLRGFFSGAGKLPRRLAANFGYADWSE